MERELDGYFRSPEDGPPKWLVVLKAYLDESGHDGRDWVIIGGFYGREEHWEAFAPLWKAALGRRKSLHMRELRRWNKDSTRQLLERLGPIPRDCGLTPIVGGVRVSDYSDLVQGTHLEKALKGYEAILPGLMTNVLMAVPEDERIEIFFEQQKEYAQSFARVMDQLTSPGMPHRFTKDGKTKIARWGMEPKDSSIVTDPADYIAYGVRQRCIDQNSVKARWCMPILHADEMVCGRLLPRDEIRERIVSAVLGALGFGRLSWP